MWRWLSGQETTSAIAGDSPLFIAVGVASCSSGSQPDRDQPSLTVIVHSRFLEIAEDIQITPLARHPGKPESITDRLTSPRTARNEIYETDRSGVSHTNPFLLQNFSRLLEPICRQDGQREWFSLKGCIHRDGICESRVV